MNWLILLIGIWIAISPFAVSSTRALQISNLVFGIVVAVLAYYATRQRSA